MTDSEQNERDSFVMHIVDPDQPDRRVTLSMEFPRGQGFLAIHSLHDLVLGENPMMANLLAHLASYDDSVKKMLDDAGLAERAEEIRAQQKPVGPRMDDVQKLLAQIAPSGKAHNPPRHPLDMD